MLGPTILPIWFVGPLGLLSMLVVAGHLVAMRDARERIPESRYRIRSVNGGIMLVTVPMLAGAFGVVSPEEPRAFALIWFACIGLLAIVTLLAVFDALNNVRLGVIERRRLRDEQRELIGSITQGESPESGHDA
ncbi:MAG: hypothetical protein H6810_12835 [Phycisphaeraceae bacterium]|nr:MAG: hypothetical protein H6810_12835 [Phycisphaeraceae bacterium]